MHPGYRPNTMISRTQVMTQLLHEMRRFRHRATHVPHDQRLTATQGQTVGDRPTFRQRQQGHTERQGGSKDSNFEETMQHMARKANILLQRAEAQTGLPPATLDADDAAADEDSHVIAGRRVEAANGFSIPGKGEVLTNDQLQHALEGPRASKKQADQVITVPQSACIPTRAACTAWL